MPLGARFPRSGIVLPGRLGGERKDRDVGCVGGLSFGVVADETDKGDSIEVHAFLLVLPVGLGHRKASGRGSQDKKLLFWGDRNDGGARTGKVREQSRSCADAGRRKSPEAVPRRKGRTGERNRTDHHSAGRAAVGNTAIQPFASREPRSGSCRGSRSGSCSAWLGNWPRRNTQQRPCDDAKAHPEARVGRDLTPGNRITDEIHRE